MKNKFFIFFLLFIFLLGPTLIAKAAIQGISQFTSTLRYGMKNNSEVINLQKFLKDQGYFSGPVNGKFGSLTFAAVKKFQAANGIRATGLWGLSSRRTANNILNKQNTQSTAAATSTITSTPLTTIQTPATTTPLSITTMTLPIATAGKAYNSPLLATGGIGSYSWWISDGLPPPGLSLVPTMCSGSSCPTSAAIFGTPVSAWTYNFTVSVKSGTQVATQKFSLVVNPSTANLKLSQTNTINLNIGQSSEIKAFYTPAPLCDPLMPCSVPDSTQVKVNWTSSDSSIASVSYYPYDSTVATINGVSGGSATITANYTLGNVNFSATVPVFVSGIIPASLKITPFNPSVAVGNTILLQAIYTAQSTCANNYCTSGSSSTMQAVWTSSNLAVATVAYKSDDPKTAVVTAVSLGVTTITANVGYISAAGTSLTLSTALTVSPSTQ